MNDIIKWYDGDLNTRLMLGMRYCERILFPEYDMRPHFAYHRDRNTGEGFASGCPGTLMSHAVGRGMDLIYNYEKYTGNKISPEIEAEYVRHFYNALDPDFGMCLEFIADDKPWIIEPHNVRETIEALTLLIEMRNDARAYREMDKIFYGLSQITDVEAGAFSVEMSEKNGCREKFTGTIGAPQPMAAGRYIGPLMDYYRLTGDKRALFYASVYSKGTLNCFEDDGTMLRSAGTHIHSITSSLSGVADYATFTEDNAMLAKLERLYTNPNGLPLVMTDFGWIKEQIYIDGQVQGEVNQIGDMAAFCIRLGSYYKSAEWYSRAETFIRGGILPSQVLSNDFIIATDNPDSDHKKSIKSRILGGYGFPMPATHLENEGSPINTLDITQGANQALCRAIENIAYISEGKLYVNLLFSCDCKAAKITSKLPVEGFVEIIPKIAGPLFIRIPSGIDRDSIKVTIDSDEKEFKIINDYIKLDVLSYDVVNFKFKPIKTVYKSNYIDTEYTITKFGEQTISVTPIDGVYPLYDDTDFNS